MRVPPIVLVHIGGFAASGAVDDVATSGTRSSADEGIAFAREQPRGSDETFTFTVNTDGSGMKRLYTAGHQDLLAGLRSRSVAVNAACTPGQENCAFTIVDANTRKFR